MLQWSERRCEESLATPLINLYLSEPLVNRKLLNSFTLFLGFLGSFDPVFVAILFRLLHLRKHIFLPPLAGNVQDTKSVENLTVCCTRGGESKGSFSTSKTHEEA